MICFRFDIPFHITQEYKVLLSGSSKSICNKIDNSNKKPEGELFHVNSHFKI